MKITLPLIVETLHAIALAIWAGGQAAVIIFLSVRGAPTLFLTREQALVEGCGILMVGVQFITRRRYLKSKPLFLADGVRHLLTFAALLLAEYVKYGVRVRAGDTGGNATLESLIAALEIGLLTVVGSITMWLQVAGARIAGASSAVPVEKQAPAGTPKTVPVRPRPATPKRGAKR